MGNTSLGDEVAENAAGAAKADDLLSQLAGAEIDRLLADADENAQALNAAEASAAAATQEVDPTALVQKAAEEASAEAAAVAPATVAAAETDATASVTNPAEAAVPTPVAKIADGAVAEETDSALAGELDKLFDELKKDPATDAETPAAVAIAQPAEAAAAQAPQETPVAETAAPATPASVAVDDATTAEERGGLIEDAAEDDEEEQDIVVEAKLSAFLKPLEWINAPFEFMPDRLRDLLGTIGIVTLMNACAILAYVHFLRKH